MVIDSCEAAQLHRHRTLYLSPLRLKNRNKLLFSSFLLWGWIYDPLEYGSHLFSQLHCILQRLGWWEAHPIMVLRPKWSGVLPFHWIYSHSTLIIAKWPWCIQWPILTTCMHLGLVILEYIICRSKTTFKIMLQLRPVQPSWPVLF